MDSSGVFTFDSSLPTPRDRMRHSLGDTDPNTPLRYDETYESMLAYWGDETLATAKLARALASQFGRQASSVSIPGGPSVSYASRVSAWQELAKTLEVDAAESAPGAFQSGRASRAGMNPVPQSEYRRSLDDTYPETWND